MPFKELSIAINGQFLKKLFLVLRYAKTRDDSYPSASTKEAPQEPANLSGANAID